MCVCVCVCVCACAHTYTYKCGFPCPPPGHLPDPGIKPTYLMSLALAGGLFTTSTTWQAHIYVLCAQSLQSCLTVCDPIDGNPPGSPVELPNFKHCFNG